METFNYQVPGFEWSVTEIKGNKKHYVEGFISTIDVDDYNEVVTENAQKKIYNIVKSRMEAQTPITMDLEHEEFLKDGKVLDKPKANKIPVAKIVDVELRSRGVWVKAEINKDSEIFDNVWGSIKNRMLHSFSIAFAPLKAVTKSINGVVHKFIEDLNLINVTLTGCPVNTNATFTPVMKAALKSMGENMEENNNTPEPSAPEAPVETPEVPAKEEKPVTVNDIVETVRDLEKQKAELAAEKAKLEQERADFEASKTPKEPAEPETPTNAEPVSPLSQVKSMKDKIIKLEQENANLKARLATPIFKSKIKSPEMAMKDVPKQKELSPLDLV